MKYNHYNVTHIGKTSLVFGWWKCIVLTVGFVYPFQTVNNFEAVLINENMEGADTHLIICQLSHPHKLCPFSEISTFSAKLISTTSDFVLILRFTCQR